jgi:hypothetical protein
LKLAGGARGKKPELNRLMADRGEICCGRKTSFGSVQQGRKEFKRDGELGREERRAKADQERRRRKGDFQLDTNTAMLY